MVYSYIISREVPSSQSVIRVSFDSISFLHIRRRNIFFLAFESAQVLGPVVVTKHKYPGFKNCLLCKAVMLLKDGHTRWILCLGEGHLKIFVPYVNLLKKT